MTDLLSRLPLETLGWTLLHFLWQGFLSAALLNAILPACRSAIARHDCALAALVLMALAPVATFLFLHESGGTMSAINAAAGAPAFVTASGMDTLVVLWLCGVAGLSLRAFGGWYMARALGRRDTFAVPAMLLHRCGELQRRLALSAPVRFLLSSRIQAPLVIGWLRPVVLIPVSALAGLAPHQLDALILHELAHIRRLDPAINMLLTAVETILFYHPAVWWVSRQVRIEREHCCDDLAVSACGDAAAYVEALVSLQPWQAAHGAALAANGGRLKHRVARLLGMSAPTRRVSLPAITGFVFVSLLAGSVAMAQMHTDGHHKRVAITELQPIRDTHTLPPYPMDSVHLKEEGRVLLGVTIGTDGAVSRASVVKPSGHPRLDDAAVQFVQSHWRWQPATRAGKPVPANTRVSVVFKLANKHHAR